jgi:hypothetical protein
MTVRAQRHEGYSPTNHCDFLSAFSRLILSTSAPSFQRRLVCFDQLLEIATCHTTVKAWHVTQMIELKKVASVAVILKRELDSTIKEWLRRVKLVPALIAIPLSDAERTVHLPKLFEDVLNRLRLARGAETPLSITASAHGKLRFAQGYSVPMLVEESRIFQVTTFGTLHRHQNELDQNQVLSDVIVIADEADRQLTESVDSFIKHQQEAGTGLAL